MTRIFFDTEFTGLRKDTSLISLGLVSECGKTFYAEFTDYNKSQVDDWIKSNVIAKLRLKYFGRNSIPPHQDVEILGDTPIIRHHLRGWLSQFEKIEIWSDCMSYDWVLFCELFGGALELPKNIYYIPFDLSTAFKMAGIDPDISREKFGCGELYGEMPKHNALWDAKVIKACFDKLTILKFTNPWKP